MLLSGKKGLIVGVANKRSIAWAIAQACQENGARLAFSYQNERLGENVKELTAELPGAVNFQMDVTDDGQVKAGFEYLEKEFGQLDFVVHAVAYAPRQALEGDFVSTTREDFRVALDVSAYSLPVLAHAAKPLMKEGGSIVTLSYLGAERVMPNYNVMGVAKAALESSVRYLASDLGQFGIRVNALSAGPIKTLASSGIGGFSTILDHHRAKAPLRKLVELEEVADGALFLLCPMGRGVTGQTIYVDGGYNIMAV
ncbi:MAG: enoyl-ACP reductase [Acidobacteria bacterium]|nr:enoyl-ACP reductase [Acidobacteriota bacterium]